MFQMLDIYVELAGWLAYHTKTSLSVPITTTTTIIIIIITTTTTIICDLTTHRSAGTGVFLLCDIFKLERLEKFCEPGDDSSPSSSAKGLRCIRGGGGLGGALSKDVLFSLRWGAIVAMLSNTSISALSLKDKRSFIEFLAGFVTGGSNNASLSNFARKSALVLPAQLLPVTESVFMTVSSSSGHVSQQY
uniref:Uncharacterized protein n=1 Tax=Glossina austeni TaxID=7395 RepID=A0A1A9UHL0_GLOAU